MFGSAFSGIVGWLLRFYLPIAPYGLFSFEVVLGFVGERWKFFARLNRYSFTGPLKVGHDGF
ncbi:hypothetical protein [Corynebacterium aquilae]|uniref:hypothetical protein n=1 Tax=Corynebacterium aquilae TaxID=203263 RepID=UPI0012ED94DF|nr:hypothetical protein [Corynebacterium aquilae]